MSNFKFVTLSFDKFLNSPGKRGDFLVKQLVKDSKKLESLNAKLTIIQPYFVNYFWLKGQFISLRFLNYNYLFSPIWTNSDQSGSFWTNLDHFGPFHWYSMICALAMVLNMGHLLFLICLWQLKLFLNSFWQYWQTLLVCFACMFLTCCLMLFLRLTCFPQTKHLNLDFPSSSKTSSYFASTSKIFCSSAPIPATI